MKGDDTMFVTKRLVSGFAALVMAVSGALPTTAIVGSDSTSPEDVDSRVLKHRSLELCPDESDSDKTVTLDGLMPKNATATAVDVTEMIADADIVTSPLCDDNCVVVAYDITISNGEGEFQPDSSRPIYVEIADPSITDSEFTELWHISDDGQREQISDFTVTDGMVSFYAEGFSVYALVKNDKLTSKEYGWQVAKSIDEITEKGSDGFYLSSQENRFLTGNTTESINGNKKRHGIKSTDPSTPVPNGAIPYYFVQDQNNKNKFYIYTTIGGTTYYVNMYVTSAKDGQAGLDLISNESQKTWFDLEKIPNENAFYCSITVDGKTYYLNKNTKGSDNEKGAFVGYADINNANLVRLKLNYNAGEVPDDPYNLDGKTYGFVNTENSAYGHAVQKDFTAREMAAKVNPLSHEGVNFIADGITMWTFHTAGEDNYYISTDDGGTEKYIKVSGSTATLVGSADEATPIKVVPQSGEHSGEIKLCADNKYLYLKDKDMDAFLFGEDKGSASLIRLIEENTQLADDDFVVYSAEKIGVSEVKNGDTFIVYTRVWDDENKTYKFYAVGHDGSLVPCYERGDDIMWIGSKINTLLWDFTEYYNTDGKVNNYYELCNQYSGKYLAPQIGGQVLSDDTIGLNMPGRRDGEYYTDILAWDDPHYAYAALKASTDNKELTSCPRSQAATFYFAKMKPESDTLTEVETIDNDEYGITMKMVDYPSRDYMKTVIGADNTDNLIRQGLLSTDLTDGYPIAVNKLNTEETYHSLADLYKPADAREVNHLFLKSTYEATGYFEFDSCQNFATLKKQDGTFNTRTVTLGENKTKEVTDFIVYRELGTNERTGSTTMKHGQFLPYNNIKAGVYSKANPYNLYSSLADYKNASVGMLPDDDPRKYERLYSLGTLNDTNYYNGMELAASFVQTPNGKDSWGHDIIFEFTGDDDFWLYVDDELVIDLGGVHSALAGNVNFSTGEVVVNGTPTTLRDIFFNNYKGRGHTEAEAKAYVDGIFVKNKDGNYVFKDYTNHKMKIFYMERGAGASNLHMRFNLSYVTPGNVILKKEIEGTDDLDLSLVQFPYQIFYKETEDSPEKLLGSDDEHVSVTYQNSTQKVEYRPTYTPPGSSAAYECVYFLNPEQVAEIHFPSDAIEYRVVECGINTDVYKKVELKNEKKLSGTPVPGLTSCANYDSGWRVVSEKSSIVYVNTADEDALRPLNITKILKAENGTTLTQADDDTTFTFRLYLTNGIDDELELANMVNYRVKSPAPDYYYCRWDAASGKLVPTEYTPSTLVAALADIKNSTTMTDEEKAAAKRTLLDPITFESSINGSISRIPAGYTVEVPNLPVGVKFQVIERPNDTELGYGKVEYQRDEGTYLTEGGKDNVGTVIAGQSPVMRVINKRGYGLEVNKKWSDDDFVYNHGTIYTAVYAGDTLISGSVREIATPNTRVRYFFEDIKAGCTFDDYTVYEVLLTGKEGVGEGVLPVADDDYKITNIDSFNVERVNSSEFISVSAQKKNSNGIYSASDPVSEYSYSPSYNKGTPEDVREGAEGKKRRDTISNNRKGGVVITLYDMDTGEKLGGGKFRLTDEDGTDYGTFESDSDGHITTLYIEQNLTLGKEYTLTEISAPNGYIGVPNPVKFTVSKVDDDTVALSVTGNETKWANGDVLNKNEDSLVARIDIYNKPFTLKVKKVDSATKAPVEGAHFALYKCVNGIKDYTPMSGYEDIVSGADGFIAEISEALPRGTYCLEEKAPPSGYVKPESDIRFTISSSGSVTVAEHESYVKKTDSEKSCAYVIELPNTKEDSPAVIIPTGIETNGTATAVMLFLLVSFGALLVVRAKRREKDE